MYRHHGETTAPEWITVAQAAEHLGFTERYVRRLIADGELPAYKVGTKAIRLRRTDVEALLVPVTAA